MNVIEKINNIKRLRKEERNTEIEILKLFNVHDNKIGLINDIQDYTDKKFKIGSFGYSNFQMYDMNPIDEKSCSETLSVEYDDIYQYENYVLIQFTHSHFEYFDCITGIFLKENNEGIPLENIIKNK